MWPLPSHTGGGDVADSTRDLYSQYNIGVVAGWAETSEMASCRGLRVLEVGTRLGVASAGLVLTALGADVVQVDLARRHLSRPERTYYDRGRRAVDARGEWTHLATLADIVLTDLGDDELLALGVDLVGGDSRAQVLVSVRSFGRVGPHAAYRTTDLTEWASTGLAGVTRRPHAPESGRYAPMLPPGQQPQALAGLAAATAALVGYRWARQTSSFVVADVSVQEVVAAMLHGIFPPYIWNGVVQGHPSTPSLALGFLLPAADGDVYIRTLDPRQWEALAEWVGDETVRDLGSTPDARLANNDALSLLLGEWTSGQGRTELVEEGQRRRVPIALPRSLADVLAWQHLRARGVWRTVDLDGVPSEAPRLPLLEPPEWRPRSQETTEEVRDRWTKMP